MCLLGGLWCWSWTSLQGETPGEPPDRGWVVGWITYFTLTASVLVYLWWKRARARVIVVAPLAGTFITFVLILSGLIPDTSADLHDSSTFFDGIWPVLVWAILAAALTAAVGLVASLGRHDAGRAGSVGRSRASSR